MPHLIMSLICSTILAAFRRHTSEAEAQRIEEKAEAARQAMRAMITGDRSHWDPALDEDEVNRHARSQTLLTDAGNKGRRRRLDNSYGSARGSGKPWLPDCAMRRGGASPTSQWNAVNMFLQIDWTFSNWLTPQVRALRVSENR